ncbi:Transcriptional regulator, AbiEi antitoxin, Type IV TA system [Mycobacterium sp. 88mf]|nr:type IV toxin-antitoxin system AbiEi family antitoxin domain-containing protein [Mycolicibacterium septicum]SEQ75404.1 Transcriptional regulator, AbiEi antitoxin, Type IV TA system [Mycobacterium sp. 88mf]SFF60959.1 Transcriptional regulator, AbiEi antitoxin, Type IV TA system [Mycobacterium sp. 455mf]
MTLDEVFALNNGVATTNQLLAVMTYRTLARRVRDGEIVRLWHGVYSLGPPDTFRRLCGLDLLSETPIVGCLGTAAQFYGFDTENTVRTHVLDPGVRMRPSPDIMVHQRIGAPLKKVDGRLLTAPAWTAIELARTLRRPRALATLDAAPRSGTCAAVELEHALKEQRGRRGVVKVRELLPHADGRAESPMESEMRLVFIDWGLPTPELQYEIVDRHGQLWRVDFAWPECRVAAEYDSMDWHANPVAVKHDRMKSARLQEIGWISVPAVVDDVRRYPAELCSRIRSHLEPAA